MEKINLDTYKRKDTYNWYKTYKNPYYQLSLKIDVTDVKKFSELHDVSFYKTMTYLLTMAINSTDEFLYKTIDGELYKLDRRESSYTAFDLENETFKFIYSDTTKGFDYFIEDALKQEKGLKGFADTTKESDELIYISAMPWFEIHSFINARNDADNLDSIPRFTWGKYRKEGDKITLDLCIDVNHVYIDGFHFKKLVDNFYLEVEKLEKTYDKNN